MRLNKIGYFGLVGLLMYGSAEAQKNHNYLLQPLSVEHSCGSPYGGFISFILNNHGQPILVTTDKLTTEECVEIATLIDMARKERQSIRVDGYYSSNAQGKNVLKPTLIDVLGYPYQMSNKEGFK